MQESAKPRGEISAPVDIMDFLNQKPVLDYFIENPIRYEGVPLVSPENILSTLKQGMPEFVIKNKYEEFRKAYANKGKIDELRQRYSKEDTEKKILDADFDNTHSILI